MRPTRRTIWELAEEVAREVATWPAWKVRAVDEALTEESRALLREKGDDDGRQQD